MGFVAGSMAGCSGSHQCQDDLCLDPPAHGFQVRVAGETIMPGEDIEYCEVVRLPGTAADTYYVDALESAMTKGSHHLIVSAAKVGSPTEEYLAGLNEGYKVKCRGAFQLNRNPDRSADDFLPVTGQQHPYHLEEFPEGVGRVFSGGQFIVFDYHYLNASDEPIFATSAVNFHVTGAEKVQVIAKTFGFFNFTIDTPPGQRRTFELSCPVDIDIRVSKLVRHTHRWGTDFNVYYLGGEKDGQMIFSSPHYELTDYPFEMPVRIKPREGFRFECSFYNSENYNLTWGWTASDEMCNLFGIYWEENAAPAPDPSCSTGRPPPPII